MPPLVTSNRTVAHAIDQVQRLRNGAAQDALVAVKLKQLGIDLLDKDDWSEHLSDQQVKLIQDLQEAKIDFLKAVRWATNSPTSIIAAQANTRKSIHLDLQDSSTTSSALLSLAPMPFPSLQPSLAAPSSLCGITKESATNLLLQTWVNKLLTSGQYPVTNMTLAEFLAFVGNHLTIAKTKHQGLCSIAAVFAHHFLASAQAPAVGA